MEESEEAAPGSQDAVDRLVESEVNEARRKAIRDLLYRKES
jgi:hypothetical protein